MRRLRFLLAAMVLAGLGLGGWIMWQRRQAARAEQAMLDLKASLEMKGGTAADHHRLGLFLAERGSRDEAVAHLEIAAGREPSDLRLGNGLRMWLVRFQQYDRSIRFFEDLTERHPGVAEARLHLALAYVDKMPDHMMGIVGQGKLSNQSLNELGKILGKEEAIQNVQTRWAALYALGMNHLYWPKALRHAPDAIRAFERVISLQRQGPASPYHVLAYLCLGDALAKDGRHEEARKVYREGEAFFSDERFKQRLSIEGNEALTEYVDRTRGLGIVIDTDLAILWGRKP